jgi:hypothetical protein
MPAVTRPQKITFGEMRSTGVRGSRRWAIRSVLAPALRRSDPAAPRREVVYAAACDYVARERDSTVPRKSEVQHLNSLGRRTIMCMLWASCERQDNERDREGTRIHQGRAAA